MKRFAEAKFQQLSAAFPIRLQMRSDINIPRKVWHMVMGLTIVALYLSGYSRSAAVVTLGSILGLDLLVEMARLKIPAFNEKIMRFWSPIMRNCEVNRMSGIPYYLAASVLAIGIFPKPIAVLSIAYLACGDPIASTFGILYGDKSIRFRNGRSLIGTAAGVLACAIVTFIFLSSLHLSDATVITLSVIGGLAGGMAEMLPLDIDDNFSIPMVSGFVLWLSFILLGV